jgi:hypothetical protein
VVTYASFVSTGDHRYHYARWTGTRWEDHEIAQAGRRVLAHRWFDGAGASGWCGPEAQHFAAQQLAVLADAHPRATPLPVNPLVRDLPED